MRSLLPIAIASFGLAAFAACSHGQASPADAGPAPSADASDLDASAAEDASAELDAGADASPGEIDPMALHHETKEEILAMFEIQRPPKRDSNADVFLAKTFGTDAPYHTNQGNKELAKHFIAHQKCMEGLAGITLQTEEQRKLCGEDNMVPIYKKGDIGKTRTCIDVFEFPNKACELPFVWIGPTQAKTVCELQGKRLCREEEWILACKGDPEGGKDQKYAYGDDLDLDVCNTNKPAKKFGPNCNPDSAKSAWTTCATNTEPSGAFPKCRSRFGVFDQHGNVAEIMTRVEDGHLVSQLKGSAFFYTDVARDEFGKAPKGRPKIPPERMRDTYPDICAHDPRWHVEPMATAWHVNYHLGFRCCKSVKP